MEESLTLTAEHQKALQQGESVPVIESGTQIKCIVVRADVFDRIKKLLLISIRGRHILPSTRC